MIVVWGKLAGLALGVFGGLPGVIFGLIVGHLLDVVAADFVLRRAVERYLHTVPAGPTVRLPRQFVPSYAAAALTVAAVAGRGFSPTSAQKAVFVREVRGLNAPDADAAGESTASRAEVPVQFLRRALQFPSVVLHRLGSGAFWTRFRHWRVVAYLDCATRLDTDIPLDDLAACLRDISDRTVSEQLVTFALRLVPQPGPGARARVRRLARALGCSAAWADDLLAASTLLDAEACLILGVSRHATLEEVRRAYRALAAQFHPDTVTVLSAEQQHASTEAFVRIRRAYETLCSELSEPKHPATDD